MRTVSKSARTALVVIALAIAIVLTGPKAVHADGIIIPDPPICVDCPEPPPPEPIWLTVKYHHVDVTIQDQVAVTRVDQVFLNQSKWQIEGTYVFPLPTDAAISDFAMWVDGRKFEGELLDRDQARRIYEEIVRQRRDPALLEYIDRGAFRVSIFPIPPGEERRVELEYSQVLPVDGGLVRYTYPLNTERFSARPLEEVSLSLSIQSADPIKAVYSPSHNVVVDREGEFRARVGYEERDVLPEKDFDLVYTVSPEDVGLNLLSYKEGEADGFFLMLVAPQVEVDRAKVVDKDVLLILDTSGSMEGEKLEQAKDALVYVLGHLNEGDRFNITDFSTGVRQYARRPQPASQRDEAIAWVRDLAAGGGTDINRALLETLAGVDAERPAILIFLTDGQPTEGETEADRILANFADNTHPNVRLFSFGVGDDVNTILLDTLAVEQRGTSGYVRPGERIDEEVSSFYAKVSTPLLADVAVEVDGVHVEEVYPYPLPDLFAGTQLVIVGRYRDAGPALIRLDGTVNGDAQKFTYEAFFEGSGGDRFIPRLWATRKIGYLLNQIRLHGESQELVDEIVELSVRYGIVTPYTSYLVQENADVLTREGRQSIADETLESLAAEPTMVSGAGAVQEAEAKAAIESADRAEAPAGEAAQVVKVVGPKTFVHLDGVWTDTTFDPSRMTTEKVDLGGAAYFELLEARPDLGGFFALGERIIVVVDGIAYEVVESGGGAVTVRPTPTPTPRQVVADTNSGTATPSPASLPQSPPEGGKQGRSGLTTLCPATLALGLVGISLAGQQVRRRRRR
jgi:Ca-activated chloride channel family protein